MTTLLDSAAAVARTGDTAGGFDLASKITSPWSLAAFAIAGVLALVAVLGRKNLSRPALQLLTTALFVIAALGLVPVLTSFGVQVATARPRTDVYRVRATVLDGRGTPVDDARVYSDVGGEWLRADGAYQVVIPAATVPATHRLVVRAARASAFEAAVDTVALEGDANATLTLRLHADTGATVRGTVIDAHEQAVAGARVWVDGYGAEADTTGATGGFVLRAHAADGQQVLLRAEKTGVGATTLYHPAGRDPATLQLDRGAAPR